MRTGGFFIRKSNIWDMIIDKMKIAVGTFL